MAFVHMFTTFQLNSVLCLETSSFWISKKYFFTVFCSQLLNIVLELPCTYRYYIMKKRRIALIRDQKQNKNN